MLIAAFVILPIAAVLLLALFPEENIWGHLVATVLPGYLRTTSALLLGVGSGALLAGVTSAWLVTRCEFPGLRLFEWALVLPFALPAYVIAYVYTDLLDYAGPVQGALRAVFGWGSVQDYWFPSIRSLGGASLMLALVLYPYVYLLARAAFLEQSPHLVDISRTLGHSAWSSFWRISLPIARPAIAAGLALVLMEVLNDYGTVSYFAVRTLTAGIYDVWLGMGNLGGGAQLASVMLMFVLILLSLERRSRARQRYFQPGQRWQAPPRYRLRGWRAALAAGLCGLLVLAGFVIPVGVLALYAARHFAALWTPEFQLYARNSVLLSAGAAGLAVLIGVVLAYGRRLHGGPLLRAAVRAASLGYALPGALLALGVLIPLAAFDNAVDKFMRDQFGVATGLLLSGTVAALIFAYVVRFLAVAQGAIEASLEAITPTMDLAARVLGHSPLATLRRVHLPLIRSGLMTAALVVFVDSMKELPATLILRPFNFDTLATYVYQFASDERLAECALGALLIVLTGLLPVLLLSRTITHTHARG